MLEYVQRHIEKVWLYYRITERVITRFKVFYENERLGKHYAFTSLIKRRRTNSYKQFDKTFRVECSNVHLPCLTCLHFR